MMSLAVFKFYYYLMFAWGAVGMLFIAVVSIREVFLQFYKRKAITETLETPLPKRLEG